MEILHIRPVQGAGNAIARFDAQLPGGIRLFNLKLSQKPDGRRRVHAPSAFGSSTAAFSAETAEEITRAASRALGDIDHNGTTGR